ncbi:hypothetical protein L1887_54785 [Cichorium endivia]|nr:hypothetical protein L1887_54785 [Cichorium endivia]
MRGEKERGQRQFRTVAAAACEDGNKRLRVFSLVGEVRAIASRDRPLETHPRVGVFDDYNCCPKSQPGSLASTYARERWRNKDFAHFAVTSEPVLTHPQEALCRPSLVLTHGQRRCTTPAYEVINSAWEFRVGLRSEAVLIICPVDVFALRELLYDTVGLYDTVRPASDSRVRRAVLHSTMPDGAILPLYPTTEQNARVKAVRA